MFFTIFITIFCMNAYAQDSNQGDTLVTSMAAFNDSTIEENSQRLSSIYYYNMGDKTFSRNYNFELFNKQRRLRMWSNEVRVLGYIMALGVALGGAWLLDDLCPRWLLISGGTIVIGGIMVTANVCANKLKNKADAIKEMIVPICALNKKTNLYITRYSTDLNHSIGYGIGYNCYF